MFREHYTPEPEPDPLTPAEAMQADIDLLLQLVLTSQDGEANDVRSATPTLRRMATRGSLTEAVVDGAFGWGVIDSDQRAELLDVALPPPVDDEHDPDHLDGDEAEQDEAT